MKKKYQLVDEAYFARAKKLMQAKFTPKEIVETIGGSTATLNRISRATDFADYKRIVAAAHPPKAPTASGNAPIGIVGDTLKPIEKSQQNLDIKLESKFIELNAKLDNLSLEVREMLEAYKWVVEHAQIDYTKKKSRWF